MAYIIDSNKCNSCKKCQQECPMDAIAKDDRSHYTIDAGVCTDCGSCADVCPEEAIRGLST